MVRKTHRGIALLLVIALSFPLLETNAGAASSYTKEALFLQFPQYLINEETQNRADEMIQSGIDVLEAQSTVDEIAANLFHFVESGLSFSVREIASEFGNEILNNKDQYCLDIAMSTLSRTVSKTNVAVSDSDKVISSIKAVKDAYKLTNDAVGVADVCSYIDFSKSHMTLGQAEILGNNIFARSDGKTIEIAGYAADAWKVFVTLIQLYDYEMYSIEFLISQTDAGSDIGKGLRLIKEDREKAPASYIVEKYCSDFALGQIVSLVAKAGYEFFDSSGNLNLLITALKMFIKYGYVGPKADEICKAYIACSNIVSLRAALSSYQEKLKNKQITSNETEYEILFTAYLCAIEDFLSRCSGLTTPGEYDLAGVVTSNLKTLEEGLYLSYPIHLKLCTEKLNEDAKNGEIDNNGTVVNFDSIANASNFADRMQAILEMYAPNVGNAFDERYGYSLGSFAFVSKVFNLLYECNMPESAQRQFPFMLYGKQNVMDVGMVYKDTLTRFETKELLSSAVPGDILLGYGKNGAHSMIVVSNEGDSLTVYDCDSKLNGSYSKNHIQKYSVSYSQIYEAFSESTESGIFPGIAVYRANNRDHITSDGTGIRQGDQKYFSIRDSVLTAYYGYKSKVIIPDGVTRIAEGVFRDCDSQRIIKEIVIPNSVKIIDDYAFYGCSNMVSLSMPAGIEFIHDPYYQRNTSAFLGCTSISKIRLTGTGAMAGYYSANTSDPHTATPWYISSAAGTVVSVEIESGVTTVGDYAFCGCENLCQVSIPDSVTSIGGHAFFACRGLTGPLKIPNSVYSIGPYAFAWCGNINGLELSEGLHSIAEHAFSNCTSIEFLRIPDSVTKLDNCAFASCNMTRLVVPAHISYGYQEDPFWGCSSIAHYTISGTGKIVDTFENMAQYNPWYRRYEHQPERVVEIANGITEIGHNVFQGNYRSIFIPESVNVISESSIGYATIVGFHGSYAEQYAIAHNLPFLTAYNNDDVQPSDMVFIKSLYADFSPGQTEMPVTVNLENISELTSNAFCMVALYDEKGHMVSLTTETVEEDVIQSAGAIYLTAHTNGTYSEFRVFLLNDEYAPISNVFCASIL